MPIGQRCIESSASVEAVDDVTVEMQCNPSLTDLIREAIGEAFLDDVERLRDLEPFATVEDLSLPNRFVTPLGCVVPRNT